MRLQVCLVSDVKTFPGCLTTESSSCSRREKGGHGVERIVCIGAHKGQNNLVPRIREHFDALNKDRSIFRKHIGRCLLAKEHEPFLDQWQLDLTSTASGAMNGHEVDQARLEQVENEVTRYITENFSFSVLRFDSV